MRRAFDRATKASCRAETIIAACFVLMTTTLTGEALMSAQLPIGEKLTYAMTYKGLPSARAVLQLERAEQGYLAELHVRTQLLLDPLFKIANVYRTLFDEEGLRRVAKQIDQKNIRQELIIEYDRAACRARADNGTSWQIPADCTQLLAMLYNLRSRNPLPGEALSYRLDVESQLWRIDGVVQAGAKKGVRVIVFRFSAPQPPERRKWRTDLLTNRLAGPNSQLEIHLGPAPHNVPLFISFGSPDGRVEMKLER